MLHPFFDTLTESLTNASFLREFCVKYHYGEPQLPLLAAVAVSMQEAIREDEERGKAGWNSGSVCEADRKEDPEGIPLICCPVCVTLGPGIDVLQEDYLQKGLLSEAYMVENLAGELLLKSYSLWGEGLGPLCVRRYHFPGSGEECPVEALPGLLEELDVPVVCTSSYCMLPKKSVAFYAELTHKRDESCQGICGGCGYRDCPHRQEKG